MKIHESLLVFFLIAFPSLTQAGWQIVKPTSRAVIIPKDQDPFIQASQAQRTQTTEVKATEVKATETNQANEQEIYRPMPVAAPSSPPPSLTPSPKPASYTYLHTSQTYNTMNTYHRRRPPPSLASFLAKDKYQYPSRYAYIKPKPAFYAVSISGSVKENVERIMRRYHWKVVWKAPYDFNYDGRITGSSLPNVIEKLFQPFPLQAVMYTSNRTLTVVPRTKT